MVAISLGATAQAPQAVTDDPAKKAVPKKAEPKKAEPKKAKPPKAAPKKVDAKPAPKRPLPPTLAPEVRVYKNSADAPTLRDKSGNVIPTNPNDYDVSSAVGKKK